MKAKEKDLALAMVKDLASVKEMESVLVMGLEMEKDLARDLKKELALAMVKDLASVKEMESVLVMGLEMEKGLA